MKPAVFAEVVTRNVEAILYSGRHSRRRFRLRWLGDGLIVSRMNLLQLLFCRGGLSPLVLDSGKEGFNLPGRYRTIGATML
jgi:hypothetical protein